jgi:hypothetical protein
MFVSFNSNNTNGAADETKTVSPSWHVNSLPGFMLPDLYVLCMFCNSMFPLLSLAIVRSVLLYGLELPLWYIQTLLKETVVIYKQRFVYIIANTTAKFVSIL